MSDYPKWCPYMHYVWSKKELQSWAKAVGGCAFYDGRLWEASYNEIAPDYVMGLALGRMPRRVK